MSEDAQVSHSESFTETIAQQRLYLEQVEDSLQKLSTEPNETTAEKVRKSLEQIRKNLTDLNRAIPGKLSEGCNLSFWQRKLQSETLGEMPRDITTSDEFQTICDTYKAYVDKVEKAEAQLRNIESHIKETNEQKRHEENLTALGQVYQSQRNSEVVNNVIVMPAIVTAAAGALEVAKTKPELGAVLSASIIVGAGVTYRERIAGAINAAKEIVKPYAAKTPVLRNYVKFEPKGPEIK